MIRILEVFPGGYVQKDLRGGHGAKGLLWALVRFGFGLRDLGKDSVVPFDLAVWGYRCTDTVNGHGNAGQIVLHIPA
jgi:hypothetical protein